MTGATPLSTRPSSLTIWFMGKSQRAQIYFSRWPKLKFPKVKELLWFSFSSALISRLPWLNNPAAVSNCEFWFHLLRSFNRAKISSWIKPEDKLIIPSLPHLLFWPHHQVLKPFVTRAGRFPHRMTLQTLSWQWSDLAKHYFLMIGERRVGCRTLVSVVSVWTPCSDASLIRTLSKLSH